MPKRQRSPVREFEKELKALLGDMTKLGPKTVLTVPVRLLREIERALLGEKE